MIAGPVFIVGCTRSGTTLLRRILNRHPSIAICPETHFQRLVYRRRKAFGDLTNLENRRRLVAEYVSCRPMSRPVFATPEFAERLLRESTSYREMFISILAHYAEQTGKTRCGEKTPLHSAFLETLCEWFPDASILHLVRDPRACVASLQKVPFASGNVLMNARRWVRINQAAACFRQRPGYLEVRYEELVTDPENAVRRICSFLNEDYSPSLLGASRLEEPAEQGDRGELRTNRVSAWKDELSPMEIAQIEWVTGPNLEHFGFARDQSAASILTIGRGLVHAGIDIARSAATRLPAIWYRVMEPTRIKDYEYWSGPKSWRGKSPGPLR
ncbi:MAG TPA: sulfotransferase [Bryobacteraceae bacterium]|nr:sulfotransferase [Bryobacteraceae bacterium]